jgi:type I restriction enzyme R subunit
MSGRFNENTRVQVPAAIHLCHLGYTYLERIDALDYDPSTNILTQVFKLAFAKLNPGLSDAEIDLHLNALVQAAKNEDGSWCLTIQPIAKEDDVQEAPNDNN